MGGAGQLSGRVARRLVVIAATAVTMLAASSPAWALPGDILVADEAAIGGNGGVVRVNAVSGGRATLSENSSPPGNPTFVTPDSLALASNLSILVSDTDAFPGGDGGIMRVDPASGVRTTVSSVPSAAGPDFTAPAGVALEADGKLVVADQQSFAATGAVFRVDPATGARSIVSANSFAPGPGFDDPFGIAVANDGDILVTNVAPISASPSVVRVDSNTGARTLVSSNSSPSGGPDFAQPTGIAVDSNGGILVADQAALGGTGGVIRVDPMTGARTAVSSNSSPSGGPSFDTPSGIALEANGDILIADLNAFGGNGGVIRVDPASGARSAVSENSSPAGGAAFANPFGIAVEPPIVELGSSKAKLKGKKISLKLICVSGTADCNGNAALETANRVKVKKIVQLGNSDFSIAAGQAETVKVKLSRDGRKLFKRRRKVKASATLSLDGPPLQSSTSTDQVKVKRKK